MFETSLLTKNQPEIKKLQRKLLLNSFNFRLSLLKRYLFLKINSKSHIFDIEEWSIIYNQEKFLIHYQNLLTIFKMQKVQIPMKWTLKDYAFSWTLVGCFVTLNNPVDLIRFRFQVMPELIEQGHLKQPYTGLIDCAKKIYTNEGFKSFFKGNLSNLIRVVPSQSLVFYLKEYFQRHFHYHHELTEAEHFRYNSVIGITSALIVSLSLYPFEYIRQQLLNRTDRNGRTITHYLKKTIVSTGISGFYKGIVNFSIGLVLFRGTYFGVYDTLKVKTNNEGKRWLASVLASYLAIVSGYPIDTVRRRFLTGRGKYQNTRECSKQIWKRQGIKGFYLGWQMILVQSFNLATIMFSYDRLVTNYTAASE